MVSRVQFQDSRQCLNTRIIKVNNDNDDKDDKGDDRNDDASGNDTQV